MTILTIIILLLSGFIDGVLEGYIFDNRKSFERKFNVNPSSFWGSLSWKKLYDKPNLYNKLLGVFDFYHIADDLRKGGYLLSGILTYKYFLPVFNIHYLILFLSVFMLAASTKIIGLFWIRN